MWGEEGQRLEIFAISLTATTNELFGTSVFATKIKYFIMISLMIQNGTLPKIK